MARAAAAAQVEGRAWSLSFENGSTRRLRAGGFFAGHDSKEDLKNELFRLFWKQEQFKQGESFGHYLKPKPSARSDANTSAVLVKVDRKRKVGPLPLNQVQGEHVQDLPVCFSTRSAQRKSKLAADEKRKLAATEKRRFIVAEKKRKLADDAKLYVLGVRRTVTRLSHT